MLTFNKQVDFPSFSASSFYPGRDDSTFGTPATHVLTRPERGNAHDSGDATDVESEDDWHETDLTQGSSSRMSERVAFEVRTQSLSLFFFF